MKGCIHVVIIVITLLQPSLCMAWFVSNGNSVKIGGIQTTKQRSTVPPSNIHILILPGFGNDASDYTLEQAPNGSLVRSLQSRGWKNVSVLPIRRTDWLQVFWNGAFDYQFWQNQASPIRPAFRWYLQRVADTIQQITTTTNQENDNNHGGTDDNDSTRSVILVCHSAGGWLARAALGYGSCSNTTDLSIDLSKICGVVTLGAPHDPPPPTVMDMTRGALRDTAQRFPGAYHDDRLFYITVIGDAVQGIPQQRKNPFEPTTVTGFAYNSYKAVCGEGETIGDGVVPIQSAHLDGAIQLNLRGIFHSINAPDQWYGSDAVIDQWHEEMLRQIQARENKENGQPTLGKPFFGNPFENIFARNLLNDGV